MIINNVGSSDSAIIDSSLVPIMPLEALTPVIPGNANQGSGAGPTTLNGAYMAGSGVMANASPVQTGGPGASASGAALGEIGSEISTIFGIPAMAFWVLLFGAVAYLILWKVHFHLGVGD